MGWFIWVVIFFGLFYWKIVKEQNRPHDYERYWPISRSDDVPYVEDTGNELTKAMHFIYEKHVKPRMGKKA